MTVESLPEPIRRFIEATNRGDTTAFLDAFASDATLIDWGRKFSGREGIASWNETDNIGVQAHFDLVSFVEGKRHGSYEVTLKVTGNGYNGTGPMTFTVIGDQIASLTIEP